MLNARYKAGLLAAVVVLLVFSGAVRAAEPEAKGDRSKEPVRITSDRMEATGDSNLVVFKGNVKVIEEFTLYSDELQIRYGEGRDIDTITALGSVRIVQGQRKATSEKAVYDRTARVLVLTGSPTVTQCGDRVSGNKITLYIDEDRAQVEGGGDGRVRAVIMPEGGCPENAPQPDSGDE